MGTLGVIDVAAGLALVYLLLASVVSAIRERIEAVLKSRAVDLEKGISELLQDRSRELTRKLYDHPLINGLFEGAYDPAAVAKDTLRYKSRSTLPSYIPARNFALALLDTAAPGSISGEATDRLNPAASLDALRQAFSGIDNEAVRRTLLLAVDTADGDIDKVLPSIENWFNSSMDRVSGWYQRRTQNIILGLSVLVTVAVNANTLTIIERLSIDTSLRQALVEEAAKTQGPAAGGADAWQALGKFHLPIGWDEGWPGPLGNPLDKLPDQGWPWFWVMVLHPLLGWFVTILAVSMGAPFWFDMLNRLTSFRSTFKPKDGATAAPATPATVVQIQAPPPPAAPTPPAPAPFQPHEWKYGNPQEGVL